MNALRQYELVLEIVRQGSISRAAKVLKISQPTLSKFINKLETQLGAQLFDRTVLPIRLTKAGELYVCAGEKILDISRGLDKAILCLQNSGVDTIKIGISPSRSHYILPYLISNFNKKNDKTKLVIKERTTGQLNAELQSGELDLIISLQYDGTREFNSIPLFTEQILIAVPSEYADMEVMKILKECPFISIGNGLRMSKILLNILGEVGANMPTIETQSIESAFSLTKAGLGATIVPSYVKEYIEYSGVSFFEFPENLHMKFGSELQRQVCIFYRKDRELSLAEQHFVDACLDARLNM